MDEWTEQEVISYLQKSNVTLHSNSCLFCFIYSPFCGTCKLAKQMIQLACQIDNQFSFFACNINNIPKLIDNWRISSVPAIATIMDGQITHILYQFHDVVHVLNYLRSSVRRDNID